MPVLSDWKRYASSDNRFELWLPPGAELIEYPDSAPGERYYYWALPSNVGIFSILRQPLPGRTPESMVSLEQDMGARVAIEFDETLDKEGRPVRLFRYRSVLDMPREVLEDPSTGLQTHNPAYTKEEIVNFVFYVNDQEAISAGYRLGLTVLDEFSGNFEAALDSFRLLDVPSSDQQRD